ncbi:MAG TPA: hypothetical protein PKX02_07680 [Candidatus Sabulitectum sp.]|nr:hypothetical protein [Candidatus Sabulitectum sp.]
MKQGAPNSGDSQSTAVWHVQPGRSRVQRKIAADGFRTEYPYAGVVVVAENASSEDDGSAALAVETVRDVFAEGVAFGVEDALSDAFDEASELIREKKLGGCSAAALAFSASHVWYALAGNCRIYRMDSDGVRCIVRDRSQAADLRMLPSNPEYLKKVRNMNWWLGCQSKGKAVCGHTRLRRDTTYLLLTSGGWIQLEHMAAGPARKTPGKSLQGWVAGLSRDLKLAYRRQGAAIAAVSGVKERTGGNIPWKAVSAAAASILLAGYLVFGDPFSCGAAPPDRSDIFSADSVAEEIVQPIDPDAEPDTSSGGNHGMLAMLADSMAADSAALIPDISASLPLQTVMVGEPLDSLPSDSFAVSLNLEPDLQWENFSPGIYCVEGDTASEILAQAVSVRFANLEIIPVRRIVTVREGGVAESASWLSSLSPDSAASTAVVVETRSSVAGGAPWIRNYPVFANGDRDRRSSEAGGYAGVSLPGIPLLPSRVTYRLIVVP